MHVYFSAVAHYNKTISHARDTTKARHAGDSYQLARMPATHPAGPRPRGRVPTGFFRSSFKKRASTCIYIAKYLYLAKKIAAWDVH